MVRLGSRTGLGGYLTSLDGADDNNRADELGGPPPLRLDGPEIKRLAALAGAVADGSEDVSGWEAVRGSRSS